MGNMYVIYMADNGAVPFVPPDKKKHLANPQSIGDISRNYPLRSGKWTLSEGGIRLPFIIRGPGAKKGAFCGVPVVGYDILPTVADLAGFKSALPGDLDGGTLRGLLHGGEGGCVKRPFDGLVFDRSVSGYPHTAIRVGDYKLVKFWKPEAMKLFNIRKDIGETNDLAGSMPEKAQELDDELMRYLRAVNAEI